MTNPYNNDKRLLELLERWQSGEFTRADEQELQSLTASDEFRREAAEGFMSAPEEDHGKRLSSLHARLRNRAGTARRVVLPQWLAAVAAVAVLIVAVVWLMPVQEKQSVSEESMAAPAIEGPQNEPSQDDASQDYATAPVPEPKASSGSERSVATGPKVFQSESTGNAAMSATDATEGVAIQDAQPMPEPAAAAQASEEASKNADLAAEYSAQEEVQTQAPERAMARKKESRAMLPGATASAQPQGGWNTFNEYLRKNARLPEQARQNNVSGTVRVRFTLDANGKPSDFQIVKSLGFGCDEAARRLIEQYSWQPGQNNELTVDVPFVR
ncbi:MAG: TonB family protein [Saprospiraceae bacterium]|nr:TonB family protein [Saprospiraceae bacterium]